MDRAESCIQAAALLPEPIRVQALKLDPARLALVEEFRLRAGRRPTVVIGGEEFPLPDTRPVEPEQLERMVEAAGRWSMHTVLPQVCRGFLTVEGGHRLGLCGTAVIQGGELRGMRDFSSVDLRVARAVPGAAREVMPLLWEDGALHSTLILAPPGAGKTTLLRDMIRMTSEGEGPRPLRVGVADERGELAASWRGRPQMDLGRRTDVLEGCAKAQGMLMLLRGMSPQVLAVDEITTGEDVLAAEQAVGCGAVLLASAHGGGWEDLRRRPLYRRLMELGLFRRLVGIRVEDGVRHFQVRQAEELGW